MKDIIENATIFFKNGSKELCNAISIIDKGVYTGKIELIDGKKDRLIKHGFIPKDQIEKITFLNEHGKSKEIDL